MKQLVILSVICALLFLAHAQETEAEAEDVENVENNELENESDPLKGILFNRRPTATVDYKFTAKDLEKFSDRLKQQMKCGYPKFGIPSLTPFKTSYQFKQTFEIMGQK
jgi:lipopolysaccharide export system protein LptC